MTTVVITGLAELLNIVNMTEYIGLATDWCIEQGADTVEDITIDDTFEELLEFLNLKPIKAKKLRREFVIIAREYEKKMDLRRACGSNSITPFRPVKPNGNVRLLVRLPQSGKTKIMLDTVTDFLSKYSKPLIIIICDNSLLLTTQTVKRGTQYHNINVGKITSNSCGYCEWNDVDSVDKPLDRTIRKQTIHERLENGEINTLVLCSNKRRWCDIEELINRYRSSFNIQLWIDEADKTVGGIDGLDIGSRRRINQLNEWKTQIAAINLITATPFTPRRRWNTFNWIGQNFDGSIELVKVDEIVGAGYHHLRDSQFFEQAELIDNPAEYARMYLNTNPARPGDIFLIPGTTKQSSHYEVRDMCLKENRFDFVIVLNGKTKSIESEAIVYNKSNSEFIKHSLKTKEVSTWLGEWYKGYNGKYTRIAITGNLCISRGITISSDTCQITHMIFSGGGNLREDDQLMSRVCGYCYSADNKPIIVCSRGVWDDVSKYQEVIIELTKLAMDPNQEHRILDEDKMNTIIQDIDRNKRTPFMFDGFTGSEDIFNGSKKERRKAIFEHIQSVNPALFMFMSENKCKQITRPRTPESYKKHVEDTYNKYIENKNFIIDFSPQDKMNDCWMAVIDAINHRVFVIVWVVNSTHI